MLHSAEYALLAEAGPAVAEGHRTVGSGYRLTYPTRKVGDVKFSLFHPIRRPMGLAIEHAIIQKLKNVLSKRDAGHGRVDAGSASLSDSAA